MANFTAQKLYFSDINSGQQYQDGDIVYAEALNKPIEASAYAQNKADEALQTATIALNRVDAVIKPPTSAFSLLDAYPVGSIYMSAINGKDPAFLFGGTWTKLNDCFLYASGALSASATGGSKTIKQENLPSGITGEFGVNSSGGSYGIIDKSPKGVFSVSANSTYAVYSSERYSPDTAGAYALKFDLGGQDKDYLPPYFVVNMWQRVG